MILIGLLAITGPVQAQNFSFTPKRSSVLSENFTYTPIVPGVTGERATEVEPIEPPPRDTGDPATENDPMNVQKVRVVFRSINVVNNHEDDWDGVGDGEFDLVAYVQGKKLDLSAANEGLWDVNEGRLFFPERTEMDVYLRENVPLSIFTVGWEIDGCKTNEWPKEVTEVSSILHTPQSIPNWLSSIDGVRQDVNDNSGVVVGCPWPSSSYASNRLGYINEIYPIAGVVNGRGISQQTNTNDFSLYYIINICRTDLDCPPRPTSGTSTGGGDDAKKCEQEDDLLNRLRMKCDPT